MIGSLTPVRTFYPSHLKRMQETKWNPNLNPLVQHGEFHPLVQNIIEYNNRFTSLYKGMVPRHITSRGDDFLQKRASYRNLMFYLRAVQDLTDLRAQDVDYESRDCDQNSDAAQKSFAVADAIKKWPSKMTIRIDLYAYLSQWSLVEGFGQPMEVTSLGELLDLSLRK